MTHFSRKDKKVALRYMDFRAITAGGITMQLLKTRPEFSYAIQASVDDVRKIVRFVKQKDYPGRVNENIVRLWVPQGPDWPEYFVDQDGRVFDGTSHYVMSPYFFLKLNDHMDYLKSVNGIKEGSFR